MLLYHGSNKIIKKPIFGYGKTTNDYGKGFYMTKDIELAKEWASNNKNEKGIVNIYDIDIDEMKILDLDKIDEKVLSWMALLVKYREFNIKTNVALRAKEFLIHDFLIDVDKYDVIKGYRADDCYFMFAKTFLNNGMSTEQLKKALVMGKLGTQYVLKSKKAFNNITYKGYEEVDIKKYYYKRLLRTKDAVEEYTDMMDDLDLNGMFINDLIRKYEKNNQKK